MLKGFFDRTLACGVAWTFPPESGAGAAPTTGLVPLLTNIERVMGVSTYGSPQHVTILAGDNGRNCISTAVRHGTCAPDCTLAWLGLYNMDYQSRDAREEFLRHVCAYVRDQF